MKMNYRHALLSGILMGSFLLSPAASGSSWTTTATGCLLSISTTGVSTSGGRSEFCPRQQFEVPSKLKAHRGHDAVGKNRSAPLISCGLLPTNQ
jgi:hypothetical protein